MERLNFLWNNLDLIAEKTLEYVTLVRIAVGLALLTGVPIGVAITQNKRIADVVLYAASVIITILFVALFGIMIPLLSLIGDGIGSVSAMIAVLLYSLLSIIRNTYFAINNIDSALREAARGIGIRPLERLYCWRGAAVMNHPTFHVTDNADFPTEYCHEY